MLKSLTGALVCALALSGSAFAQLQTPQGVTPNRTLPPGTTIRPQPACSVDLAITGVTLSKGMGADQLSIAYEITNLGPSAWSSGANQQTATLVVHNNNTNADYRLSSPVGRSAAAGARVSLIRTPMLTNAVDFHEFGGTVNISLAFDPDIAIDNNACNDDRNAANNTFSISTEQVNSFIHSRERARVFRR